MKTDLLEAHLSGELTRDEAASVESALRNDQELREVYFNQVKMDAALRVLMTGEAEVSTDEFSAGIVARLKNEGADHEDRDFSRSVLTEILEEKEKIEPLRWPDFVKAAAIAGVAAIIAVAALQAINFRSGNEVAVPQTSYQSAIHYPARVQATESAVWSSDSASSMRPDGWLSGGVVELQEGVAELAFNSGARAFVEGPAQLSVESENRIFLERGRLTAEVPSWASGFTVNTPQMNIVDIGTRFGVSVDANGESEVHVMEGLVEASRSKGNSVSVRLREGLSLRADTRTLSSLVPIPYSGDQFSLNAGDWSDSAPAIEFTFDESGGAGIYDSGSSKPSGPLDLSLMDSGDFDDQPRRAPGVRGGSLIFRPGQSIATSLPNEFRLEDAFTISFWVKIPPRVGRVNEDKILCWGRGAEGWQIGCRHDLGGSLVARFGEHAFVLGSTDLADGKWHHVAVRNIGTADMEVETNSSFSPNTHTHLYIDGTLEKIGAWNNGEIRSGRTGELRIGDPNNSGFQGWVDEVVIFQEAVSTATIQDLVTK